MENFNLQKQLNGKRAQLLALGISKATVGRLLYTNNWLPKSNTLIKLRGLCDLPFVLTGTELAARMKRLNVSISEMHRRSGVSRGMISSYLKGTTTLRADKLKQLVDALPAKRLPSTQKLTAANRATIIASTDTVAALAKRYSIDPSYVSKLRTRAKRQLL